MYEDQLHRMHIEQRAAQARAEEEGRRSQGDAAQREAIRLLTERHTYS